MSVRYLSLHEVLTLHEFAIQEFGGSSGVISLERLEISIETLRQQVFGEELYPDLFSKAAILFFLLVKNHCFVDGNKRTAVLAMFEFLERNGYTLNVSNDELYEFTIKVASCEVDKTGVESWVRQYAQSLKEGEGRVTH
ncbi:MAG TPA: type II toxin-antitoxin system death-on-curing family toxin [Chloroflexi bacterium]|nr:type II toxin-antitoxin system death-on-curing family toxin [Chloroflexota bacterium]